MDTEINEIMDELNFLSDLAEQTATNATPEGMQLLEQEFEIVRLEMENEKLRTAYNQLLQAAAHTLTDSFQCFGHC